MGPKQSSNSFEADNSNSTSSSNNTCNGHFDLVVLHWAREALVDPLSLWLPYLCTPPPNTPVAGATQTIQHGATRLPKKSP